MMSKSGILKSWMWPVMEAPRWTFYRRCTWVVARLMMAYWFANQVSPFFYQRF
jgi:hypothetical protein